MLFGGFVVLACTTFRVTRDSDIELLEQESDDMLRVIAGLVLGHAEAQRRQVDAGEHRFATPERDR